MLWLVCVYTSAFGIFPVECEPRALSILTEIALRLFRLRDSHLVWKIILTNYPENKRSQISK